MKHTKIGHDLAEKIKVLQDYKSASRREAELALRRSLRISENPGFPVLLMRSA